MNLPELPATTILSYAAVPNFEGRALIRLQRCGKCYDEIHDYHHRAAYCIPVPGTYRQMDADQRAHWDYAEQEDSAMKPLYPISQNDSL